MCTFQDWAISIHGALRAADGNMATEIDLTDEPKMIAMAVPAGAAILTPDETTLISSALDKAIVYAKLSGKMNAEEVASLDQAVSVFSNVQYAPVFPRPDISN
jgi:hypothetical protein